MKKTILKTEKDSRINNMLAAYLYEKIANEHLAQYGRELSGGWSMSCTEFSSVSYARNHKESQLEVVINYAAQTVTIIEKTW